MRITKALVTLSDVLRFRGDIDAEKIALGETPFALDEDFLRALAAMPPSGGAALGVDRLCMVLLDQAEIDGVRAFLPPVGGLW